MKRIRFYRRRIPLSGLPYWNLEPDDLEPEIWMEDIPDDVAARIGLLPASGVAVERQAGELATLTLTATPPHE